MKLSKGFIVFLMLLASPFVVGPLALKFAMSRPPRIYDGTSPVQAQLDGLDMSLLHDFSVRSLKHPTFTGSPGDIFLSFNSATPSHTLQQCVEWAALRKAAGRYANQPDRTQESIRFHYSRHIGRIDKFKPEWWPDAGLSNIAAVIMIDPEENNINSHTVYVLQNTQTKRFFVTHFTGH
jgi:hypothetical protein